MRTYYSTYKISRIVSDDLWSKVFRFNKNVRLFKQMGISYFYRRKKRVPIRLKAFHKIRLHYKDYSSRKSSIRRFMERRKFKFFYGYLNNKAFKLMYFKIRRPISYNIFTHFLGRFELLAHMVFFRASFFTDTITTYQLVLHNFAFINGRLVNIKSCMRGIGEFASFSRFFYFPRRLKQRIKQRLYIFPSKNMLVSEFLPIFVFFKYYRVQSDSKKLFNASYASLSNLFLTLKTN